MGFEFTNKVLLLDKDPEFLMEMKSNFDKEGEVIDLVTSSSASKGIGLLGEENFDAVVSCSRMQKRDYIDFLNKIRNEREIEVPFVLLIDKKDNEIILEALKEGVNRVIHKEENINLSYNILLEVLNQEIQQYLRNKELEQLRYEFNKNFRLFRI